MVQAYLYYVLDAPTMSDAEYYKLSVYAADHWDELTDERKFCLGSPEELRASGHHIKFTMFCIDAALEVYKAAHGKYPVFVPAPKWKTHKPLKLRYCTA